LMSWPVLLIMHKGNFTIFRIIGLAFVLAMFLLIYSRGGLIVFCGQLVLLGIYYFKRIKLKTILMFLAVVLFAIGIFTLANNVRELQHQTIEIEEKVTFGGGESISSMQERKDFWAGSLELIEEKPLFGWGPFSFRYAYNPIQKTLLGNSDHPHNVFLKIGAENGLIAMGTFIAFLFVVFFTVIKRFPKLSKIRKDFVYLISVAIAGGFAHSLIDYNFNFIANLLLLFVLLIMLRSAVVVKDNQERKGFASVAISLLIVVFAIYELIVLALSQTINYNFLSFSFYPRDYYVSVAEKAVEQNDFGRALTALEEAEKLNSLDSRTNYLEGEIYCDEDFQSNNPLVCKSNFAQALAQNPMNNFTYYFDYVKLLSPNAVSENDLKIIQRATELLEIYFDYVELNLHFTAYTENVESAYELAQILGSYLSPEKADELKIKSEKMLSIARKLRTNKTF
ncbi:MAG: O-antigen ligase family protein, partial [Candidatus Gracilibacteria bacterium]|nr:O-antigen ligase family protein [Candidatus Gracilibacteria bacterium]